MAPDIAEQLTSARRRLQDKLANLDPASAGLSEYNQRYLGQKLTDSEADLQLDVDLLRLCLAEWSGPLDEFVLVDYGAGGGILSFLAKELGVGTVVYEDIYDVSCEDARRISQILGLP